MNKTTSIILIILLTLLIIILTMIMIVGINKGTSIFNMSFSDAKLKKEEIIDLKDIKNIEMNFVSEDVRVYVTYEEELYVKQYGNEDKKELFTYEIDGDTIKVNSKARKFCIGFCFFNSYFEIYIPKSYLNNLYIHSTSGDIVIFDELKLDNLNLNTTSGDIDVSNSLSANEINIKSVSGDIKLDVAQGESGTLNTTSGDIEANYLSGKYNIKTISGDIEIVEFDGSFDISSTSGDVDINRFGINAASNAKTVSGDVEITLKDNYECRVESSTISGSEKIRNSSDRGDVLKIKTTSGDIKVK